ncbi:cysteine ABC transporter permease [Cohnella sp. CIP 111063]|jgi:L-cystine transport system permease protein|uniref:amino acid ABC transporter permease n=1 Tax=unclassified Cohnella TaxID=2636738 RepID=UPI000B8C191F|nr:MULTISPECIES: amino acid ABC transporter permease [unclassified Cohnella]OXS55526.1 cysteine ABC transporter permease [Cohnella sp. CIP 111063]PRX66365.1 L-cystine transport system permease protein [Cohnella sp. SGD-V74]
MGAKFDIRYVFEYFVKLLPYIQISLFIVASSIVLGLVFGLLAAIPRLYRVPVLQRLSQVYASFFRGTPILIQLFLFYYGLPEVLKLIHIDVTRFPVLVFVILVYGLHSGAYVSEGIRAAVTAVDRGQVEAAYAVGMSGFKAFTRIVFPQALAIAVPILANLVIATLKDTSLAFTLGVMELTGKAQTLPTMSRHFIESYIALAAIYFIVSVVLERLFLLVERRMLKHERETGNADRVPLGKKWLKKRTNAGLALSKGGTRA